MEAMIMEKLPDRAVVGTVGAAAEEAEVVAEEAVAEVAVAVVVAKVRLTLPGQPIPTI
jgi:hypothetical protein